MTTTSTPSIATLWQRLLGYVGGYLGLVMITTAAAMAFAFYAPTAHAENLVKLPAPRYDPAVTETRATAILAGGCFWGVEGVFAHVKGVISVKSGYHGGEAHTATYRRTNRGDTGHAEAVEIIYDPTVVSYGTLLRVLFSVVADPTLTNRQGPDIGSQYRAAIVPLDDTQKAVAVRYLEQIEQSGAYDKPIVVPVESHKKFYDAEEYHQNFMERNPNHPYIRRWDAPKLAALKQFYPGLVRVLPAP